MTPTKSNPTLQYVLQSKTGIKTRVYFLQNTYRIHTHVHGRVIRRSTTREAEAREIAESIIADLDRGMDPATNLSTIQRSEYLSCQARLGKVSITEAVEFYLRHNAHDDPRTVVDVASDLLEVLTLGNRSQAHLDRVYFNAINLSEAYPGPLARITTSELNSFLARVPNPVTRNARRRDLIQLWNHAKTLGVLPLHQPTAAENTVQAVEPPKDPETVSPETLATFLHTAFAHDKRFVSFLVLGGFCGIRTAEIRRLRWSDIANGHVILSSAITKTRRRRVVPIPPNAALWLERCRPKTGNPKVLPLLPHNMMRRLRTDHPDLPETPKNFLRHTAATMLLASGMPIHEVASRLGNSPSVLESHYKGLATKEDADRYFSIEP